MPRKRIPLVRPPPTGRLPSRDERPNNRLLARLPLEDFRCIRPDLETIPLSPKQVLLKRGEPIRHVYFPNGCMVSVTAMMKNGSAVEVATVGDEGMLGITAFFGGNAMPGESMVQVPTPRADRMSAERMSLVALRRELDRRGALYDVISRYSQATVALMMQSTARMALHHVHERCCRWLLTHDRIGSDNFTLAHEFLAMMLGSTRPTVTDVARDLQKAGLIRYTHARMTILDRRGLEAASCECYSTITNEFRRLGF